MSLCDPEGSAPCSEESEDESDGAVDGRWLGIALGAFFFIVFVIWFIRTLASRPRRLRLLYKIHHCCELKPPEDGHIGCQAPTPVTTTTPSANGGHSSSNGVIYYTPTKLPDNGEKAPRSHHAPVPSVAAADNFGRYHTEGEQEGEGEREGAEENGTRLSRPRQVWGGMRKSRSSLSMHSVNLAPIQEVEDSAGAGADTDTTQRLRGRVLNGSLHGSSRSGSKSHPARLASLASDSEEEEEEDEEKEEGEAKEMKKSKMREFDPRESASIRRGSLGENQCHVNVNFEHGSDDEGSTEGDQHHRMTVRL